MTAEMNLGSSGGINYDPTKTEYKAVQTWTGGSAITINTTNSNPVGVVGVTGNGIAVYWLKNLNASKAYKFTNSSTPPSELAVTYTSNSVTIASVDATTRGFTCDVLFE